MGFLVDTSIFVDLERSSESLESKFGDEEVFLAAVSASEMLHGVHWANSALRRARRDAFVEKLLQTVPVLVFDLPVARIYAQIWADVRGAGQNLGAHDLQIGATALHHNLTVLTINTRDFHLIPGLRVATP